MNDNELVVPNPGDRVELLSLRTKHGSYSYAPEISKVETVDTEKRHWRVTLHIDGLDWRTQHNTEATIISGVWIVHRNYAPYWVLASRETE